MNTYKLIDNLLLAMMLTSAAFLLIAIILQYTQSTEPVQNMGYKYEVNVGDSTVFTNKRPSPRPVWED